MSSITHGCRVLGSKQESFGWDIFLVSPIMRWSPLYLTFESSVGRAWRRCWTWVCWSFEAKQYRSKFLPWGSTCREPLHVLGPEWGQDCGRNDESDRAKNTGSNELQICCLCQCKNEGDPETVVHVNIVYEVDKIPEQRVVHGIQSKHSGAVPNNHCIDKSHLLFGWEVFNFMRKWRTLGGLGEQNIEGVHPKLNQLKQKVVNSRLAFKQNHVFLSSSCSVTQRLWSRK